MFRYFITTALLLFVLAEQAQAQAPSAGPRPKQAAGAPIDGGASLLLAGGVGYVIRKVRQRRAK